MARYFVSRFGAAACRVACVVALLSLAAPAAQAHATLDRASPRVGSVGAAPSEVRLWFTEQLEPRFSRAELRSAAGAVVATGKVDGTDPRQVVVPVRTLAPGKYHVFWKVFSTDSHASQGDFGFEVAQ